MSVGGTKRVYRAHSRNDGGRGIDEPMSHHLSGVCARAARMAAYTGFDEDTRLASLLHDLGKYTDRFEQRLDGLEKRGLDHSSAGAWAALTYYGSDGDAAAQSILGHHIGLQPAGAPWGVRCRELRKVLDSEAAHTGSDVRGMLGALRDDGFALPNREEFETNIPWNPGSQSEHAAEMVDVRMLFSSLVDADFIETEAHFNGGATIPRRPREVGPDLAHDAALQQVLAAAAERQQNARATHVLMQLRNDLLANCLTAAEQPTGLFTLTAPTGAGKTLSMLAFALAHARRWNLRRVIMVIPYLTIIEQTARICHVLFGSSHPHCVIEDHSHARMDDGARDDVARVVRQRRLLAENWDAPIVLTTSLAALESLHAHEPRRCRKLHQLAKSVLLFDEVQTLPPQLAALTLASLSRLAGRFGSTVLFSTATQPAFDSLDLGGGVSQLSSSGWRPREIVLDIPRLFTLSADRYTVEWRIENWVPWDRLAAELLKEAALSPVLAIVNLKRHATRLIEAMRAENADVRVLHLSTNLCARHRERVLDEAVFMLKNVRGFIFVTTQCIEAGVDISAPVVYRALAPLESIAQAAGRCNRHGTDPEPGRVKVFVPEDEGYPPGAYEAAAMHTRAFLSTLQAEGIDPNQHNVLSDPGLLRRYYEQLYGLGIHQTKKASELMRAVVERDFPEVSRLYRLIDQDTVNVLVPYDRDGFEELVDEIEQTGRLTREWIAKASPFMVSLRRPQPGDDAASALRPLPPGTNDYEAEWFTLQETTAGEMYDAELLGLKELKANWFA